MAKGDSIGTPQGSRLGALARRGLQGPEIMGIAGPTGIRLPFPGIPEQGSQGLGGMLGGIMGRKMGGPFGGMAGEVGGDLLQNFLRNQMGPGKDYVRNSIASTARSVGGGGNPLLQSFGGPAGLAGMGIGIGGNLLASKMKEGKASGAVGGASTGASIGSMFGGPLGMGIGALGGALVGAIKGNQNTTKGMREDFAKKMGYRNLAEFNNYLSSLGPQGAELRRIGEGVIGKKDKQAQMEWFQNVNNLLGGQQQGGNQMQSMMPFDIGSIVPSIRNRMMAANFNPYGGAGFGPMGPISGGYQAPIENTNTGARPLPIGPRLTANRPQAY